MKDILLASHGELARGLKDTAEFFLGPSEQIVAVSAYVDEGDDYLRTIERFIDDHSDEDALIFTDIAGGSVNQQVVVMLSEKKKKIPVISQMNLPIVLALALEAVDDKERILKLCSDAAPKAIDITTEQGDDLSEDDFFM